MNEQFVRDATRKFSGSYVVVQQASGTREIPVYVREISLDDTGVASLFASMVKENNSVDNIKFDFKEVVIKPAPKSRVFDANGITFIYRRKTERQWTRGVSHSNSHVYTPLTSLLELSFGSEVTVNYDYVDGWSLKVMQNLFTSQAVSLEEGISILNSGKAISKSITKQNWISLSPKDNTYLLWWMDRIIASFNIQDHTVEIFSPLYRQEAIDFFRRQGVMYDVI